MSTATGLRPTAAGVARDRLDAFAIAVMTVLCAIWGLQQVAIKTADLGGLPPALQAGLRSTMAGLFLTGWVALRGGWPALRTLFRIDRSLVPGLVTACVFSAEFLLLYFGLEHTTASRGVLFLYTSPFFVVLGTHLFVPGERLSLRQVLGLLCAFAGIGLAMLDGLRSAGATLLGDTMVMGTAALWATLTVMAKASPGLRQIPPAKVLLYQLFGSAPILLGVAAAAGEMPALGDATALAYALLLFQGGVVAFASYLMWYWLITRYPAGKLAAFTFLTPLFGAAAGALLLAERIPASFVMALGLVVAGLQLVNARRPLRKA